MTPAKTPELLDVAGIAALTGLKKQTIHRMMAPDRRALPDPDYRVGATSDVAHAPSRPLWEWDTINTWWKARQLRQTSNADDKEMIDLPRVAKLAKVGAAEVQEWIRAGEIPQPDGMLGKYPVWRANVIYRWLAKAPPRRPLESRELWDFGAIIEYQRSLGRTSENVQGTATLRAYLSRGRMPNPDYVLAGMPLWKPDTIKVWEESRRGQDWSKGMVKAKPPSPEDLHEIAAAQVKTKAKGAKNA